tara:strand:+ start:6774 stop:7181 length:408 start_codon:yes stop_codon:yes gene_type:complete
MYGKKHLSYLGDILLIEIRVFGKVKNGKLTLNNKDDFQNDLYKLHGDVVLTVKELPKKKTSKQNNYYRGVIVRLLAQHLGYSDNKMHEVLKFKFDVQSTSKLSQDEFQEYLDRIIRWSAQFLDFPLPDPTRLQEF